MPADQIADDTSHRHIGGVMFSAGEARNGNGSSSAISEPFHPGARVFMGNHAGHRPSEEGVPGRKGAAESVVAPETAVAGALIGAFSAGDELKTTINRQSVEESLGTQHACFTRVIVVRDQAGKQESSCRSRSPIKPHVGDIPAHIDVIV